MSLTRVSKEGKLHTSYAIGGQTALPIPMEYMRHRGLEKGQALYAHTKRVGNLVVFCYSESNPNKESSLKPETRKIQLHGERQFRINMPPSFYTAMNHSPGDKYEVYHDQEGTLIYEKVDQ